MPFVAVGRRHLAVAVPKVAVGRSAIATDWPSRGLQRHTTRSGCLHAIVVSPQDAGELPDWVNSVQVTIGRGLPVPVVLDAVLDRELCADPRLAALLHQGGIIEERPD